MKNFKKVIALGSAVMMSLTMGVSALAATADYEDGFVKLTGIDEVINAENQWTVVVIDAAKQNATLTAEDLYYINQGTSGDAFWTDGMGTKVELEDGDYIVRIGGETITSADDLIEITLTVSSTPEGPVYILGDVDNNQVINATDAAWILTKYGNSATVLPTPDYVADVDGNEVINATDAAWVLTKYGNSATVFPAEQQ